MVILTGGIDLSVGSMISLLSELISGSIDGDAALVLPVLAGVIVLGALLGAINGACIVLLRVHPLIVTLGTGAALQGLTLLYSSHPPGKVPDGFDEIAYGRLFDFR
jgi:ribose transport system permease protein